VLVCGGRNYDGDHPWNHVMDVLGEFHAATPISAIIEGGATGADSLARSWAKMHRVKCITVPADWAAHGRAAGPIRNRRMLFDFKPDIVIAFPGGRGTEDMIRQAEQLGIKVARECLTVTSHADKLSPIE
jgi:hypothetical protein